MIDRVRQYLERLRIGKAFRRPNSGAVPAEVEITPFYASVHSYVSLAEQVPLSQLRELLNDYFDACSTEIQQEGGTIDRFMGDIIVAMFGAPRATPHHALHACVAALKCQHHVCEIRSRIGRELDKWDAAARNFRVRIGLHTGSAIVGEMGTPDRPNFTMMGDNVNLAARLEAAAKHFGVRTLCSDATKRACEHSGAARVLFRCLGRTIVKGREQPLVLFEPAALAEEAPDQLRECIGLFEAGLARYEENDHASAAKYFEQSAQLERDRPEPSAGIVTNPSLVFLARSRSQG